MAKKHYALKRLGWVFLFLTVLASLVGSHLLLSSSASAQIVHKSDCPSGEYIATGPGNYGPAYCFGPQTCEANEGTWTGSSCKTNSAGLPMNDIYSGADPWKQVMMQLYTRAIVTCAENTRTLSLSQANNTSTWFMSGAGSVQGATTNFVYSSLLDTDDDGALRCTNENGWLDTALRELGFTDKIIALCTIGYQRTGGDGSYTDCIKGQGDRFEFKIDRFDIFNRFKTALGIDTSMVHRSGQTIGSSATATGDVLRYLFYKKIMESRVGCSATLLPINSSSDDDLTPGQIAKRDAGGGAIISLVEPATAPGTGFEPKWYFAVWEPDGKEVRVAPGFGQNNPGNQWRIIREGNSLSWSPAWNDQNSCIQISQYINASALNYTIWANENPTLAEQAEESADGVIGGTAPGRTTCAIDGIGWFMCPIMSGIGWVVDGLYKWVESTLIINPLDTHTDAGTQTVTYTAWQNMRNIANVILVIGFLIIIFSQLTGAGVSNYGVKKLLPRLVIVAIAINVSYLLMQVVVDVVNIIGVSIMPILNATGANASPVVISFGDTVDKFLAGSLVGLGALAAGGVFVVGAGGFAAAAIIIFIFLLGAFLSLIAAFFTIFIRNAIIIILAVVAPIAIAAYLLPNTEKLFDQWRKLLTSMLFLFPTVALLFGGAKLASTIVGGQDDWWAPFVAMFIAAAPLGLLPFVVRSSNKILSTIGGGLQKLAQRTTQGARGVAQPFLDARKAEYKSGQRNIFGRERNDTARTRRRTIGQKFDQDRQKLESRAKTAKTESEVDFKRRGTDAAAGLSTRRSDQSIARVTEAAGAAGVKNQAEDARVKERITQRMRPGGDLSDVATKIRDAEKGAGRNEKISEAAFMIRDRRAVETGGVESASTGENLADIIHQTRDAQELIKEDETFMDVQQEQRIANNEMSAVPGASGSTEFLGDIRKRRFKNEEDLKAAQLTVEHTNLDSGVADEAIQEQKRQQLGVDAAKSEDQRIFDENVKSNIQGMGNVQKRILRNQAMSGAAQGKVARRVEEEKATEGTKMYETEQMRLANEQAMRTAKESVQESYAEELMKDGSTVQVEATGKLDPVVGLTKAKAYGVDTTRRAEATTVGAARTLGGSNAEAAYQAGLRIDPASGNLAVITPTGGLDVNPAAVLAAAKAGGVVDAAATNMDTFSTAGRNALSNVQEYSTTPFGATAIVESLIETKQINSNGLKEIMDTATFSTPAEREAALDELNKKAAQAGLPHLTYNSYDNAGNLIIGGKKGGAGGVVKGLIETDIAGMPKQLFRDPQFIPEAGTQLGNIITSAGRPGSQAYDEAAYRFRGVNDEVLALMANNIFAQNPSLGSEAAVLDTLKALRMRGRSI